MSSPAIAIPTHSGTVDNAIRPPGSKSITNRALLLSGLASGTSTLQGLLDSDDTRVMITALQTLGVQLEIDWNRHLARVSGGVSGWRRNASIDVRNSGTSVRFLTAVLSVLGGEYRLSGVPRMHQRPIGDLVAALQQLGASVVAESPDACPPVRIAGPGIAAGSLSVRGNLSSQYLSGLLMAAPLASGPVRLEVDGPLVSRPYVEMTLEVMRDFGVDVRYDPDRFDAFEVEPTSYQATHYEIEPDASAASYFMGIAAICGGTTRILGLDRSSLQGDVAFADVLEKMGCDVRWGDRQLEIVGPARHGIDCDMGHISDTVQTAAVVSLFVAGPTTLRGIAHNRIKETDRIGNLAVELRKLGARVDELEDGLRIHPGHYRGAELATYDDHRMAMSFSLAGLRIPDVRIADPDCVSKTYPNYFDDFGRFLKRSVDR